MGSTTNRLFFQYEFKNGRIVVSSYFFYARELSKLIDRFLHSYQAREIQLRGKCKYGSHPVQCTKDSNFCTDSAEVCDGIANCPNGEDELIEICETYYPPLATRDCLKKDVYNINITIKAFKCDGNYECEFGEDEAHCSLPDYYLIIAIPLVAIFNSVIAFIIWKSTIKNLQPINFKQEVSEEELDEMHDKDFKNTIMNKVQSSEERKQLNNKFFQMELKEHSGLYGETICCIKVKQFHHFD